MYYLCTVADYLVKTLLWLFLDGWDNQIVVELPPGRLLESDDGI